MFGFGKKKRAVTCPFPVLFEVLDEDLNLGICCDIFFTLDDKKHSMGAYGDNGNTYKNVKYYLDETEVDSLDELKELLLHGCPLKDYQGQVTVTECDGFYPDGMKQFASYL